MEAFHGFSVAIIDDHPIFCKGVASILVEDAGFGKVLQGTSAEDAIRITTESAPDIVILDLDMPGGGLEALARILEISPDVHCVVLTASDNPHNAVRALETGARAYILKGIGSNELINALRVILGGGTYVSPSFATTLLDAVQKRRAQPAPAINLSVRECQVMRQLEAGLSNRQIAEVLSISESTVKFYMYNIMQKLGVKNRVAAVMAFQKLHGSGAPPPEPLLN